jgi:peptide/nickel transport system permease protein
MAGQEVEPERGEPIVTSEARSGEPAINGVIRAPGGRGLLARVRGGWRSLRRSRWSLLFESTTGTIGLAIVVFWVLVAVFAPLIAPYGYDEYPGPLKAPPGGEYLMGTDHLGRDVLSRLIYGSRPILLLAPLSVLSAVAVGTTLGLTAGFFGGVVDDVLMRLLDAIMAFPTLLLYMIVIAAVGASRINVVIAITIGGTPAVARVVRSLVLDVRNREFVQAARLRGESALYIMFREILPNCLGPLVVDAALRVGYAAFAIGALGFLGLGLPPPSPDWGFMIYEGRQHMVAAPWLVIFPSVAISSLVIGLNLFADGISASAKRV